MSMRLSKNMMIVDLKINKVKYKIKFIESCDHKLLVSWFSPGRGLRSVLGKDLR